MLPCCFLPALLPSSEPYCPSRTSMLLISSYSTFPLKAGTAVAGALPGADVGCVAGACQFCCIPPAITLLLLPLLKRRFFVASYCLFQTALPQYSSCASCIPLWPHLLLCYSYCASAGIIADAWLQTCSSPSRYWQAAATLQSLCFRQEAGMQETQSCHSDVAGKQQLLRAKSADKQQRQQTAADKQQ